MPEFTTFLSLSLFPGWSFAFLNVSTFCPFIFTFSPREHGTEFHLERDIKFDPEQRNIHQITNIPGFRVDNRIQREITRFTTISSYSSVRPLASVHLKMITTTRCRCFEFYFPYRSLDKRCPVYHPHRFNFTAFTLCTSGQMQECLYLIP